MVQVPFEVRVEGYEPEPPSDLGVRAVTKADVAHDVSAELRNHFDRHPLAPEARPLTAEASTPGDFRRVLNDGAQRALRDADQWHDLLPELAWAWQVVVAVPLGAFFASLMTEAGKDAYIALKRLMHRLYTASARRQGSMAPEIRTIELSDTDSGLTVPLRDKLPDKAYRQLLTITLPPLPNGCSLDRLLWLSGRWILDVKVPIPNPGEADDVPWPQRSTVLVPLVWQATDRRWTLPPEDKSPDYLYIQ